MTIRPSFIPGILWFIIATILFTLPGSELPSADWLDKIYFDKWVHTGIFALLILLWCWAMLRNHKSGPSLKNRFISIAIIWLGYGIIIEFIQKYFIPGRSFDLKDIAADTVGCIAGYFYSYWIWAKK